MVVDEFGREVQGASLENRFRGSDAYSPPAESKRPSSSPFRHGQKRFRHAVEHYMDSPMLCGYLWHQEQSKTKTETTNDASTNPQEKQEESTTTAAVDTAVKEESKSAAVDSSYEEYRHHYCLKYVRSFFNEHLDDSWFRQQYSPLARVRAAQAETQRAMQEAQVLVDEISLSTSLHDSKQGEVCSFVLQARLGGGIKTKKRPLDQHDSKDENSIPKSHVLSLVAKDAIIPIHDIPPHVTDEQLQSALQDHCSSSAAGALKVTSTAVTFHAKNDNLHRTAYCVCDSSNVRQDVLQNLAKANYSARRIPQQPSDNTSDGIPRKQEEIVIPKILDLDVDCSDPYGRLEMDPDGKGGAPTEEANSTKVAPRRATVLVFSQVKPQAVTVLSAAVSCRDRIQRDKEAAVMLARALDVARFIPRGTRLDDLLELLSGTNLEVSDVLDVSIAYLRRVHLFSFYKECTRAQSMAHVLSGNHAAATIHLRLAGADELLQQAKKETHEIYGDLDKNQDESETKDLLVMRLDDAIAKALEQSNEWVAHAGLHVLENPTIEKEATEIERAEELAKSEWIENHCIVDADGRARCSFHFCRKLFKDKSFLRKHLAKKHGEFLRAEVAKCHDGYMMKSWDGEANRPVPPVLVDCGAKLGLVLSPVTGAEHPTAADPEPDLWEKEQERRKRMEEREHYLSRREDRRGGDYMDDKRDVHHHGGGGGGDMNSSKRGGGGSNFVDVDDVKVEKVELSFENVEVPIQPPKKKKKRKKLL